MSNPGTKSNPSTSHTKKLDKLEVRQLKREEAAVWDNFVESSPQGSIFSSTSWLSQYPTEAYQIVGAFHDGQICAGMVCATGASSLYKAKMLGPLLPAKYKSNKRATLNEIHKRYLTGLASYIDSHKLIPAQTWHDSFTNALAFMWKGFEAKLKYSYTISPDQSAESVWDEFQKKVRTEIRKAEKQEIQIERGGVSEYIEFCKKYPTTESSHPREQAFYKKMESNSALAKRAYSINSKIGDEGLSSTIFLEDSKNIFYFAAAHRGDQMAHGAQSLVIWHQIQKALTESKRFDFLGSVIPEVEKFFRGFGGELKPRIILNLPQTSRLGVVRKVLRLISPS